jgi:hypothetical protein
MLQKNGKQEAILFGNPAKVHVLGRTLHQSFIG